MRSLALAKGQYHIISLGLFFLVIASSAGIVLPNYQGQILDRVIGDSTLKDDGCQTKTEGFHTKNEAFHTENEGSY